MRKTRYILLLSILFFACKKTKLDGELAFLVGEWKWEYTIHESNCVPGPGGGIYNDTIASPSINGYDYSLVFIEKGKLEIRKNGKKEKRYRIVRRNIHSSDTAYAFYMNNKEKKYFSIGYKIKGGKKYLHTNYFPQDILNGFDGCNVKYSVFRKVE